MLLLQTCNSVVYTVVMGLVLGQSLMVISTMGILLYAKVSPLYNVLWECIGAAAVSAVCVPRQLPGR